MEDEMDWVCSTRQIRNAYEILLENLSGRGHVDDLGADWRIEKLEGGTVLNSCGSG
jgi:hypothetical protein